MLEIGGSLREARERRGLELAQVEAATMIRARYLEALEEERFEVLPAGAYRRSFLREYAEFLGLDGDVYTDEYNLRVAPPEPEPIRAEAVPAGAVPRLLDRVPLTGTAAALVAVVAVLGLGVWLLGGTSGTGTTAPTRPATTAASAKTTTSVTRKPARRSHPAAVAPVTTTRPAPPKTPPPLVLTAARGNCWLQVRIDSSTGPIVFERTLGQGQTVRFGLRKPLWVRVGAPSNLDVAIGSRDVTATLPSRTGNVLVNVSGLRPAG